MANDELSKTKAAARRKKLFPQIISILTFAGFTVLLFIPDLIGWNTSLFQQICNVFKGTFNGTFQAKIAMFGAVAAYGVLIICTTASFFIDKKKIIGCNLFETVIAIAAFALLAAMAIRDYNLKISEFFYDSKTYLALNSVGLALIFGVLMLIVSGIHMYKGYGVIKLVFLLFGCSFFAVAAKKFIDSYDFIEIFTDLKGNTNPAPVIFSILAWTTVVNLGLCLLGFWKKRTALSALFRSGIILIINITAIIALGVHDSFGNIPEYLGTLIFVLIALAQFVFALLTVLVMHSKAKKKAAAEDENDDNFFLFDENEQMEFADTLAQPASPTQSDIDISATDAQDSTFDTSAQISFDDLERNRQSDSSDSGVISGEEVIQNDNDFDFAQAQYNGQFNRAYEDYAAQQENWRRQQEQQQKQEEEWNRRAEQQRRREEEWQQRSEQQRRREEEWQQRSEQQRRQEEEWKKRAEQQRHQEEEWQLRRNQQSRQEKAWQEQQSAAPNNSFRPSDYIRSQQTGTSFNNKGYVPDAFLSTLTAEEKDEFDRLFISRIYGDNKRLPIYRVGGDNREFFIKVFVFMGRYRNVISTGLLEKIYAHSNSLR